MFGLFRFHQTKTLYCDVESAAYKSIRKHYCAVEIVIFRDRMCKLLCTYNLYIHKRA